MQRFLMIGAILMFATVSASAQSPEEVRTQEIIELGRIAHRAGEFEKALRHYQEAAEMGSIRARGHIGSLYLRGHGVPKDVERGLAMLREAAAIGDVHSMYVLGASLGGQNHMEEANTEAGAWLLRASRVGHVPAMVTLSEAFQFGVGIPKDPRAAETVRAEARLLLRKAANDGSVEARVALGRIYMQGIRVEQDLEEAERWLLAAAGPENIVARRYLGSLYLKSPERYAEARRIFHALADDGDYGGMHHLKRIYAIGLGVEQSYERAAFWFLRAAKTRGRGVSMAVEALPHGYRLALQRRLKDEGVYDGPVDGGATSEFQEALICYPNPC